jgi:ribosomal protein S27AE
VRHSAQEWRVDYEIEHALPSVAGMRACPNCGDEAIVNGQFPDSVRWLGCGSCGNVWLDEADGHVRPTR